MLTRIKHVETLPLIDCIAPGLLAAQAIGRWGNYFNQELFGGPTDLPWGLEISPGKRPPGYLDVTTFHPTFLYESLYCLFLLGVVLWVERRFRLRKGQMFALYLATYTFGRFFFENMRIDPANEIFGVRLNAWVSAIVCILSIAWFVWLGRRGSEYPPGTVPADRRRRGDPRRGRPTRSDRRAAADGSSASLPSDVCPKYVRADLPHGGHRKVLP